MRIHFTGANLKKIVQILNKNCTSVTEGPKSAKWRGITNFIVLFTNDAQFSTDNMPISSMSTSDDLQRITSCLHSVADYIRQSDRRALSVSYSRGGDPSTSL